MSVRILGVVVLGLWLLSATAATCSDDEDFIRPTESSAEFRDSLDAAMAVIGTTEFENALKSPPLGSASPHVLDRLVGVIRREDPIPGIAKGDSVVTYDVILQPGHHGRPPGKVGTAGKRVSERALVAYLTQLIARKLESRNYKVLVVDADHYIRDDEKTSIYEGLSATTFLAVHLDGHKVPCSIGPSLGYSESTSMIPMHQLAVALAISLGYSFDDYRKDNITTNLSQYYMFKHVRGAVMRGVVEVGELTCPKWEDQIILATDEIASNLATALDLIIGREKKAQKDKQRP